MGYEDDIVIGMINVAASSKKIKAFNYFVRRFSGFEDFILEYRDGVLELKSQKDNYSGHFDDVEEFAFLLANTISAGRIKLKMSSSRWEEPWGYSITPGKVREMFPVWKIGKRIEEPKKFASKFKDVDSPMVELYHNGSHQFAVMGGMVFTWDGVTWVLTADPPLEEVIKFEKDHLLPSGIPGTRPSFIEPFFGKSSSRKSVAGKRE